jgi:hypothetical protein
VRWGVWLTTLSTVVAVATGIFTLRDQIFSRAAVDSEPSHDVYEQSVGQACDALNRADRARARDARHLAKRLSTESTTLAQRNALLENVRRILARGEGVLVGFQGLEVPSASATRHDETADAWSRIVGRLHDYAQRLDAVSNRHDLLVTVKRLPAIQTKLAHDSVTRDAGLTGLGKGRCKLNKLIVTGIITLPDRRRAVNRSSRSQMAPAKPPGAASSSATEDSTGQQPRDAGLSATATSTGRQRRDVRVGNTTERSTTMRGVQPRSSGGRMLGPSVQAEARHGEGVLRDSPDARG